WGGFLFPTVLLLTLVFPRPKRVAQRHPVLVSAALFALLPALRLIFGDQWQVGWGLVAVFGALALVSLVHTLLVVRRDPVAQAQANGCWCPWWRWWVTRRSTTGCCCFSPINTPPWPANRRFLPSPSFWGPASRSLCPSAWASP